MFQACKARMHFQLEHHPTIIDVKASKRLRRVHVHPDSVSMMITVIHATIDEDPLSPFSADKIFNLCLVPAPEETIFLAVLGAFLIHEVGCLSL